RIRLAGGEAAVDELALHEGVAAEHGPGVGEAAGDRDLRAAHARLADVRVPAVGTELARVGLARLEHVGVHRVAGGAQVPLHAELDVAAVLGLEVERADRVAVAAFADEAARRRHRGRVREVHAALLDRLPDEAGLPRPVVVAAAVRRRDALARV